MSKDRERQLIKRRILHFAQKGDYKKAIEECKKYLKIPGVISREAVEIKKKMADFYEKLKDYQNALQEYIDIADIYVKEGFAAKAPPLLKKALQFADKSNKELVLSKMAEVYTNMGLKSEVIKCYSSLIDIYAKRKEHYKAKEVYEKILQLDPGNLENRVRYIEYLLHIGFKEEAKTQMEKLLDKVSEKENKSIILPVYEKMPSLFSTSRLKVVAQAYFAKGEYQKGINVLRIYLEKGGRRDDPELFEMLYYGFSQIGKPDKALLALKELLKIYGAQKNQLKLKRVYERILEIDPENKEAKAFLEKYEEKEEEEEGSVSYIIKPDDFSLLLTKLEILTKFDIPGYREKAEELVKNIDVFEIEDELSLKRLASIFKKLQYVELLSLVYTQLAKLKEKSGELDKAREYVQEALNVWSENPHAVEIKERLIPEEEIVTEVEIEEVEEEKEEPEIPTITQEVGDGEYDLEKALTHPEETFEAEESVPETEPTSATEEKVEIKIPSDEELQVEIPESTDEVEISHEHEERVELPEEEKVSVEEIVSTEPLIEPSYEEESQKISVEPVVETAEESVEFRETTEKEELNSLLQEMEFFKNIGDTESVKEICQKILNIDPYNESAKATLKELEAEEVTISSESFEEIKKAMEEFEAPSLEREEKEEDEAKILQEVLEEFKQKVAETYSKEDAATHYELGHAYMEMELWDEAIKEFEIASHDRNLRLQTYSLLGRCYRNKGDIDSAIKYYTAMLEDPSLDEEGKAVVKKDIAELLEEKSDYTNALNYYKESLQNLPSAHPERNKVESKIKELEATVSTEEKAEEEEKVAEVKDITTARKKKKKIHYM